ncbi:MAG: IS982 family transposase [Phormidesmis sp.]
MDTSLTRLDLAQIFCDVDDFYSAYERFSEQSLALPYDGKAKSYRSRLSLSEVMTIVIAFHGSGFRTFKDFYTCQVLPHWRSAFPHLVSYTRFVELVPWSVMALACFLQTTFGELTGISFIDATSVVVCDPNRARSNKVFKDQAHWGRSSVKWYFGLKLHLIINDKGELLAATLTPGNIDDRKPVPEMANHLTGKLFGDKGYVSQALFEQLYQQGLQLIAKRRKNMTNRLMSLLDKVLLRKRAVIESVNDQLKNICQIEHSRHRSGFNFLANLIGGLIAYSYHPKKPSLDIPQDMLNALPPAIF